MAEEYTFFSKAHTTFAKREHILSHKAFLNKVRRLTGICSILSDHNGNRN
jgi:hypothetical protein